MSIGTFFSRAALVGAVGLLAVGCASKADIEEIKKTQKEILSKLENLPTQAPRRPQVARPDASKTYAVPVGNSATKGPNDAWVTVVEISDFQCPFCKRVGPTLTQIEEKYGDDVRFVFKHNALPFHKRAKPAALAAECARDQGKFWEMHDKLFEKQRELEDADLEKYAQEIGLNTGTYKACYTSNKHSGRIDGDQRMANSFGARGTPAFFINGRFLSGAQPFSAFQALIDEELKKAKASGVSKEKYYATSVLEKGAKKL